MLSVGIIKIGNMRAKAPSNNANPLEYTATENATLNPLPIFITLNIINTKIAYINAVNNAIAYNTIQSPINKTKGKNLADCFN